MITDFCQNPKCRYFGVPGLENRDRLVHEDPYFKVYRKIYSLPEGEVAFCDECCPDEECAKDIVHSLSKMLSM